jgi:hypothetical protein
MAYSTVNKSSDYFNTVIYSGNSSNNRTISGFGFNPDFVWVKCRGNTFSNTVNDIIRGTNANQFINETTEEVDPTSDIGNGGIGQVTTDGFIAVQGTSSMNNTNVSGEDYASWAWKANGSGVSNSDGSITSTVSANTTSGFSIVSWTGTGSAATVGHGLGAVPKFITVKNRGTGGWSWYTYHQGLGNDKHAYLNNSDVPVTSSTVWNTTTPTSSVFSLGTNGGLNGSGNNYIAYCFADVPGFSKSGTFIGNGSSSAPTFVYTGFKPKFVIVKNISQSDHWFIHDDTRDGYNDDNEYLFTSTTQAEGTNVNRISLYSNGFNVPTTDKSHNVNGNNYIYLAFGQTIASSNGTPATAR